MNIAFFQELHFGGARRVVFEYGNIFSRYHNTHLYYIDRSKQKDLEKVFKKNSFYFFPFKRYKGGNFLLRLYKDFIEPVKLYFLHKKIAREIDKHDYDFVFVHPSQFTHAPFILRFLKTPTVYFCHEPLRIVHDPLLSKTNFSGLKDLYEKLARFLKRNIDSSNIKKASIVLANSNFTKKNIKKAYGVSSKTCYLGVNPKIFHPMDVEKAYDLIFVGEKVWIEGYDTLLKIQKKSLKRWKIRIVKSKNGRYITDIDLALEYNRSKILVVLGRSDPFSMIPWEGMACGIPVIVVKEGGPIEAVKNGKTGYLIERDIGKLKKKIDLLLKNPVIREKIGENGRKDVITNWTWEESYKRVMRIAEENL